MNSTAVILVGGKGTRLSSVLPDTPKPLAPVAGRPFLEFIFDQLIRDGFQKAVLLTGHKAENFDVYKNQNWHGIQIRCVRETEPLGSAGALLNAREEIGLKPFVLLNGDTYISSSLMPLRKLPESAGTLGTLAAVKVRDASRYGRLLVDPSDHRVLGFAEKGFAGEALVNAGAVVLSPQIFNRTEKATQTLGRRFISLETDLFPELCAQSMLRYLELKGEFIDIGIPESYAQFNELMMKES